MVNTCRYFMNLETIKKHKWEFCFLLLIIAGGTFLRAYNFTKWLHFEIDQTYDINTVSPAVEKGIANLPLVGPNVGGGALRLGPAFYYMEYLSALIFGDTPQGHAMQVLMLNILSVPFFYIFIRRYFSREISIGLTAVFSFSLYHIMYSRFSWSPNVLPFLVILSFYTLLRSVSKQEKHPARWFLISIAAITITSQIHFNSFFVVPLITALFLLLKMPRFPLKVWAAALAIILIIYSPLIFNDIKTGGENLGYFKDKMKKTTRTYFKPKEVIQALEYDAYGNWFIISGNDQINGVRLTSFGFDCATCRQNLPIKLSALAIFFAGAFLLFFRIFKERDPDKKNFTILISLWFLVSIYLLYTIAKNYRMYPRFYLVMSPMAVILFGLILDHIKPHLGKIRLAIFSLIILVLVGMNVGRIIPIFEQLADVPYSAAKNIENGDIFPNTNRLTLEEEINVVNYIEKKHRQNGFPVYLTARSEYISTYWYLLEKRGVHYYGAIGKKNLYAQGNYFDIKFSDDSQSTDSRFNILEKKDMGAVIVYYMVPKPKNATAEKQNASDRKIFGADDELMQFLTWKKLFSK